MTESSGAGLLVLALKGSVTVGDVLGTGVAVFTARLAAPVEVSAVGIVLANEETSTASLFSCVGMLSEDFVFSVEVLIFSIF